MNENQWFQELHNQEQWSIVSDLSNHNAQEQFYLCAYCCDRISGTRSDTVNEHVEARAIAPERSLDYHNIVASCKTKNRCDGSHKSQKLPLTPLMDECEAELKFKISGRVEGLTARAKESIRVLNLGDNERNNKALIEKRKQLSESIMWANGVDPNSGLDDESLLTVVIDDLLIPNNGKLEPFAPVVANILRNWIPV
ncbi:MAG: hypothetical protein EOP48_10970 [Sphingobacteriales bacterium]|nr:MAG: hypothetical protein EOP48_10970 [Sphingobacteriales bacterium]